MNDNILRIRVPASLADRLKHTAAEYGRSVSDVVREGTIINLRSLEGRTKQQPANANDEPPQAA